MGALFSKPKAPNVTRMPDVNDPVIRQAQDRKRREISGRSGRSSTMLSRGAGEGGTQSYSNSLLGSAG